MCNNPTLLPTSACPTSFSSPDSGIATLGNVRGMVRYTTAHTQKCDMHVTIVLLYRCNAIKHSDVIHLYFCVTSLWLVAICAGWSDDGPDSIAPKPPRVMCERWTQPHRHKVAVNILNTELKCRERGLTKQAYHEIVMWTAYLWPKLLTLERLTCFERFCK